MIHPTKKSGFPGNSRKTRLFYCTYQLPQLADQLEFVRMSAAQYLPPRGRGTAKRWMRNGDTFPFLTQSSQRVQPFPMYLFNEMHTDSEHIAVPHPPPCGGTFPPGEGIALRHPCTFQLIGQLGKTPGFPLIRQPFGLPPSPEGEGFVLQLKTFPPDANQ